MVLETKWKKLSENKRENRVNCLTTPLSFLSIFYCVHFVSHCPHPHVENRQGGHWIVRKFCDRAQHYTVAKSHGGSSLDARWQVVRFLKRQNYSCKGRRHLWKRDILVFGSCSPYFIRFDKSFFRKHWVEISTFCAVNFPEINDRTFRLRRLKILAYAMCSFSNDV